LNRDNLAVVLGAERLKTPARETRVLFVLRHQLPGRGIMMFLRQARSVFHDTTGTALKKLS